MTALTFPTRRRWFHRYAVVEQNLITNKHTIVSWHITETSAVMAITGLLALCWDSVLTHSWDALPVSHALVRELEHWDKP